MATKVSLSPVVQMPASQPQARSRNLSATDEKIHCLLILKKLLQTISITLIGTSFIFCFLSSPAALLGLIPAVAFAAIAHWVGTSTKKPQVLSNKTLSLIDKPKSQVLSNTTLSRIDKPTVESAKVIIEARKNKTASLKPPISLENEACNCWANATLQMMMNVEALKTAALLLPPSRFQAIHTFTQSFENAQKSGLNSASGANSQKIRLMLHGFTNGAFSKDSGVQEDAAQALDALFAGRMQDYLTQTLTEGAGSAAPFFEVEMEVGSLKNLSFDYIIRVPTQQDDPRDFREMIMASFEVPRRMLFNAPSEFLVQMQRFNGQGRKITSPLNIATGNFQFPKELLKNKADAFYSCDAFIEHRHNDWHNEQQKGSESSLLDASINAGHYVAWVKVGKQWYLCDDANVQIVSEARAQAAMQFGYIYHFSKTS